MCEREDTLISDYFIVQRDIMQGKEKQKKQNTCKFLESIL